MYRAVAQGRVSPSGRLPRAARRGDLEQSRGLLTLTLYRYGDGGYGAVSKRTGDRHAEAHGQLGLAAAAERPHLAGSRAASPPARRALASRGIFASTCRNLEANAHSDDASALLVPVVMAASAIPSAAWREARPKPLAALPDRFGALGIDVLRRPRAILAAASTLPGLALTPRLLRAVAPEAAGAREHAGGARRRAITAEAARPA